MTKLLIAEIRMNDGTKYKVRTYANERCGPRIALCGILPRGSRILSYEWIDTLTERRKEWNRENPDCRIPLNL